MKFGKMEVHTSFDDEGMIETEKSSGPLGTGSERLTVIGKDGGKIETNRTKGLFGAEDERLTITTEDERAMGKFADTEAAKLDGEKTGKGGEKFKRAWKNVTIGLILLAKSISGVEVAEARQTYGINLNTQRASISMAGTQQEAIQLNNETVTIPSAGDKVTSEIKLAEAERTRSIDLDTGDLTIEADLSSTEPQHETTVTQSSAENITDLNSEEAAAETSIESMNNQEFINYFEKVKAKTLYEVATLLHINAVGFPSVDMSTGNIEAGEDLKEPKLEDFIAESHITKSADDLTDEDRQNMMQNLEELKKVANELESGISEMAKVNQSIQL